MRIATLQSFNLGLNAILDAQASVNKTQQQVSSGRRVLTPADDPIASTKILQLQQDLAQRDQYDRNMTAADNRLKLEESSLESITEALTRLQELTVNAGSGTRVWSRLLAQSRAERRSIVTHLKCCCVTRRLP